MLPSDLLRHQACKCCPDTHSGKSTHTPKLNYKQNKNTRPETSCPLRWGDQGALQEWGGLTILSGQETGLGNVDSSQ
ncbi:rCG33777 [Rattus norvegicus]|uniref:RCG33777 n=1 Tax=Rattus norvegicus TaxID=10116 RepID=A6HJF5_RAT|nr:rCG33777 [Rattus norvegicus]